MVGTLALSTLGGLLGGPVGAAVGGLAAGYLFQPKQKTQTPTAPTVEGASYDLGIPEFCGTVGSVQGNFITVAKDGAGNPAGILVTSSSSGGGKGGPKADNSNFYLTAECLIGRSAGGDLFSPDELFVDLIEREDQGGRVAIYDRNGTTDAAKGFLLTQTISEITGRVICETSDVLRLYTGTDEQMPDSAMAVFWPDVLPAHRGCAKVVFNQLPLNGQLATFYYTVRSAMTGRRALITQRLGRCGISDPRIVLDAMPSSDDPADTIEGKVIPNTEAVRDTCEKTARVVWCDFAFDGSRVVATNRTDPTIHVLSESDMGAWNGGGGDSQADAANADSNGLPVIQFNAQKDYCSEAQVQFLDKAQSYEQNTAIVPQPGATWSNALSYDVSEVMGLGHAHQVARALRDENWIEDSQTTLSLMPGHDAIMVGDVVQIPLQGPDGSDLGTEQYLVLELEPQTNEIVLLTGTPWASHVYDQPDNVVGPVRPVPQVVITTAPLFGMADCVALSDWNPDMTSSPGLLVWFSLTRLSENPGISVQIGHDDRPGITYNIEYQNERATCGVTTADFDPESVEAADGTIQLKSQFGELTSAISDNFILGANVLVFANGLVVRFETATIDSYDEDADEVHYTLSGLILGEYGSDYAEAGWGGTVPSGTEWVLVLDEENTVMPGVRHYSMPSGAIGSEVQGRGVTRSQAEPTTDYQAITYEARNMQPLSATIATATLSDAGGLYLHGRSRTRYASDNYQWDTSRQRMSEPQFSGQYRYQLTLTSGATVHVMDLYTSDVKAGFDWTVSAVDLTTWFGAVPDSLDVELCQYGHYGLGRPGAVTVDKT